MEGWEGDRFAEESHVVGETGGQVGDHFPQVRP